MLCARDGSSFPVVRSQNFNERIGRVRASQVAVVVPEGAPGSGGLHPVSLQEYLIDVGKYGGYAGVPGGTSVYCADRDAMVGIRFQSVFLPVSEEGTVQMYNKSYNYQTRSDEDPSNIILLCTTQGTFLQQDGAGTVPQYLHRPDTGGVCEYECTYLEAMRTRHGVGMQQEDSTAEAAAAASAGKATSGVIGVRAMGLGFNRLMTVQVPLKQVVPAAGGGGCFSNNDYEETLELEDCLDGEEEEEEEVEASLAMPSASRSSVFASAPAKVAAKAARVSHGSRACDMEPPRSTNWARDEECSVTITVQFYFVVLEGSVPSDEDVRAAIDVCEAGYAGCDESGKLMEAGAWWAQD